MNSIKITHNIPEKTITIEEKRDIAKMSEEDLIWCFGSEIKFNDLSTGDILMGLDVALFGFLDAFLGVINEFTSLKEGELITLNDPYGAYSLEVSKNDSFFMVVDNFSGQSFQSNFNEVKSSFSELLMECTIDVEKKFPALTENQNYKKLRKRFFDQISTS